MRKIKFVLSGFLFVSLLVLAPRVWAINKAFFSLSPPDVLPRVGQTFNIDITLSTDEANVKSADAVLTFDPAKLSVVTLTPGAIFDSYPVKSFDALGNIKLSGLMSLSTASFSGIGKFGTITFKGISSGTTTVSFFCTPGETNDSNITQILTNMDIIDCGKLSPSSISIAAAVGAPTATPVATASPPPAGNINSTFLLSVLGLGFLTAGGLRLWLVAKQYG